MGNAIVKAASTAVTSLRWFDFRQNNSGGSFIYNENVGINVYIQATSLSEANERAESIGIYFDGCYKDIDCDCCGDRWYEAWGDGEAEIPQIGLHISGKGWVNRDYALLEEVGNMKNGYDVFHFYDGTRQYGVPQLHDGDVDCRVK